MPAERAPSAPSWVAARLQNRRELARDLGLSDDCDHADVVRSAVARWGDAAAPRLRGSWAYAIEHPGGSVEVVRDAIGLMPAYWATDSAGRVHVSESLESLARVDGIDLTPNDEYAAAEVLRAVNLLTFSTPAIGIHRVPGGSRVRVDGSAWTTASWWRPEEVPPRWDTRLDDAVEELRALLRESVAAVVDDAIEGGGPVAAHLSGGLDSTYVAFAAHGELRDRGLGLDSVASWSPDPELLSIDALGLPSLDYDERDLVRDLAASLGVPALFGPVDVAEASWLAALPRPVQPRETIVRESHLLPLLAGRGVRHVMSGWGGDEFASFNGRGAARAAVRGLRMAALRDSYRDLRRRGRGPARSAWSVVAPGLPDRARRPVVVGDPDRDERVQRRMAALEPRFPDLVAATREWRRSAARATSPRDVQLRLIRHGHLGRRIESWREAGLRFGVTYHYPLVDLRLVEWALSMPPEAFRVGGRSRRAFRLAVSDVVPAPVVGTAKADPVLIHVVMRDRERQRAQGLLPYE